MAAQMKNQAVLSAAQTAAMNSALKTGDFSYANRFPDLAPQINALSAALNNGQIPTATTSTVLGRTGGI